jgi:flagellar hook-associated protein 2
MGITANGLGSGLNINSIVSQLVSLEQQRFAPKAVKQAEFRDRISLFGAIKSNLSSLQDAGNKLRALSGGSQTTTNTDNSLISATLNKGTIGTFEIGVTQLSGRQSIQTIGYAGGLIADGGNAAETLTIEVGDPATPFVLNLNSEGGNFDLADVASAINNEATLKDSIQARVETIAGGPEKRLVIESKTTGADKAFSVTGTGALAALNFDLAQPANNAAVLRTQSAQNAQATINGTAYESSSNEFSNVVSGLSFTALKTAGTTAVVTGTFGVDNSTVKARINEFVTSYNKTVANLKQNQTKDARLGKEAAPGRIEAGLRNIIAQGAQTDPGVQKHLADFGLKIDKDGVMVFDDTAKFDAAVAADPQAAVKFFGAQTTNDTGLISKLNNYIGTVTGTDGLLELRNKSLNDAIRRIDDDRLRFNKRVEGLEQRLFKQFAALDASIASLQSSQNLLAQRLDALNSQQRR